MDLSALIELLGKAGISIAGGIGAYVAVKQDIAAMRERLSATVERLGLAEKQIDYQRDRLEKHLDRSRRNTET